MEKSSSGTDRIGEKGRLRAGSRRRCKNCWGRSVGGVRVFGGGYGFVDVRRERGWLQVLSVWETGMQGGSWGGGWGCGGVLQGRPRRMYSTPLMYKSREKPTSLFDRADESSANALATNFNPTISVHCHFPYGEGQGFRGGRP